MRGSSPSSLDLSQTPAPAIRGLLYCNKSEHYWLSFQWRAYHLDKLWSRYLFSKERQLESSIIWWKRKGLKQVQSIDTVIDISPPPIYIPYSSNIHPLGFVWIFSWIASWWSRTFCRFTSRICAINSCILFTSCKYEGTRMIFRNDSFRSFSCTKMLKWSFAYSATVSDNSHLNWCSWFTIQNWLVSGEGYLVLRRFLEFLFLYFVFLFLSCCSSLLLELDEEESLLEVKLILLLFVWTSIRRHRFLSLMSSFVWAIYWKTYIVTCIICHLIPAQIW